MSLASLFLSLVLFPLKPILPQKTKRELELEAQLELATFALNHWRSSWHALWAENERLRAERASQAQAIEAWRNTAGRLRAERQASADNILQNLTKLQQYQRLAFPDCTCVPARAASITRQQSPNLTS